MVELLSHSQKYMNVVTAVSQFCMTPAGRDVCRSFVYVLFGPSNLYFDQLLHTILNHIPAGASYKQFIHYAQISAARKLNCSSSILLQCNEKNLLPSTSNPLSYFLVLRKIPAISSWHRRNEYEVLRQSRSASV